ncbi:MAG: hypothetical protein M1396_04560 [Chloroflexi bacterium]|nr:hypothetical protein [Chloroflexota bacterium]
MALYAVVAGNVIQVADLNQFFGLLTGGMSDQPVTLASGLGGTAERAGSAQLALRRPAAASNVEGLAFSNGVNVAQALLRPANSDDLVVGTDDGTSWTETARFTAVNRFVLAGVPQLALQTVQVSLNMGAGTQSGTVNLPVAYRNQCAFVMGSLSWNTDSSGPQQMLVECQAVSAGQVEWRVTVFSAGHYTGTLTLVTGGF